MSKHGRQPFQRKRIGMQVPLLNQPPPPGPAPLPQVLKPEDRKVPVPMLGLAVVRIIPVNQTASGILLADTVAPNGDATAIYNWSEIVVTSGRYALDSGAIIESDAKPGDRVVVAGGSPIAAHWSMPDDHRVIRLIDVWAVHRKEELHGAS